jgi:hypothetical protein
MATHCSHSILYIDFTVSRPPQAATRQALRNVFVEWISPLLTPFYVCAVLAVSGGRSGVMCSSSTLA